MNTEGPLLEALLHRLAECPPEFLEEPRLGSAGKIHVAAVVGDLLRNLGGVTEFEPVFFQATENPRASSPRGSTLPTAKQRNRLRIILIACWLLHDEWFRRQGQIGPAIHQFLALDLDGVAEMVDAPKFVTDEDRREEMVRLALKALSLRPAGESIAQAQDRLTTLDSVEMRRVMQATKAAEERARKIREELAKKAAEAAASKVTRE
jgi:hypothetical protein